MSAGGQQQLGSAAVVVTTTAGRRRALAGLNSIQGSSEHVCQCHYFRLLKARCSVHRWCEPGCFCCNFGRVSLALAVSIQAKSNVQELYIELVDEQNETVHVRTIRQKYESCLFTFSPIWVNNTKPSTMILVHKQCTACNVDSSLCATMQCWDAQMFLQHTAAHKTTACTCHPHSHR